MSEKKDHLSFYIAASHILVGVVAFFFILYIGQEIIVPLIFATILAILLNPFVNFLQNRKINRIVAIAIAVVTALLCLIGLFYFIGSQAARFTDSIPQLKAKIHEMFVEFVNWASRNFNTSPYKVKEWVAKQQGQTLNNSSSYIGKTLNTISSFFVIFVLLPVYIFLILLYKSLILQFIALLFPAGKHNTVKEVLDETKTLVQSYLIGLLIEAGLVAILNTLGLFILGIDYALLLGVIGALLNIIPYIGGMVAISLPMIIALTTKDPIYVVYVVLLYMLVQLIDNNFIVPRIVASKVQVNALVSIVVVLIGGCLWGVAGMFLALPLTAICKVMFDRIEPLKPLGFLIGDNMPTMTIFKVNGKRY